MSIWSSFSEFFGVPVEAKSTPVPQHSSATIERAVEATIDAGGGASDLQISAVMACARVIAEGLALPPCYLNREGDRGMTLAKDHSLYRLLHDAPNPRQTSYEFREQLGLHLALNGNAHVWVNRVGQEVRELLPCDPGSVSVNVDQSRVGGAVSYTLYGTPMPAGAIWHLKGPSWLSWDGMSTLSNARAAIGLSRATQTYGANLFKNGAKPGGILNPTGAPLTPEQVAELKAMWSAQATGVGNAHKTILLTAPVDYTPLASNANDAQWIESRRFQIEEVCRFFRVSPTKVFQQIGSQSYASVEQAHLAHDQDTDAHWHTRFVQSANKALLTDKERATGLTISIDNRDFLRGTAKERMEYYKMGIEVGMFTRNDALAMEGFPRSDDPLADELTPAANLFGPDKSKPVVE